MNEFLLSCLLISWSFPLILGKIYFPPEILILTMSTVQPTTISDIQSLNVTGLQTLDSRFGVQTRIVVSKFVENITLQCQASYPIMWAIDSLEHKWVGQVYSARRVNDINDKSTYQHLMSVTLSNAANNGQAPGVFLCHAVYTTRPLSVATGIVFWESRELPYWNPVIDNCTNCEGIAVYWKPDPNPRITILVTIPCYTLNEKEVNLELFKKTNGNLQSLNPELGLSRFEPYVGFVINSSQIRSAEEIYECHADVTEIIQSVIRGSSNTTAAVTRQKSQHKRIFRLKKSNSAQSDTKLPEIVPLWLQFQKSANLTLSRNSSDLLEGTDTIECCEDLKLRFSKYRPTKTIILSQHECSEPLLCLTNTHAQGLKEFVFTGCVEMMYVPKDNPSLFQCISRRGYVFPTSMVKENGILVLEFATMYLDNGNASSYIQYKFRSVNDNQNKGDVWQDFNSNPIFYIGEIVQFQCKANRFLFSAGVLWELEWFNNTSKITAAANLTGNEADEDDYTLTINDDQISKISCHVPQWNTSDWTTLTMSINIRASSAPVSVNETTYLKIILYDRPGSDSIKFSCAFQGVPRPKLTWGTPKASFILKTSIATPKKAGLTLGPSLKLGETDMANSSLSVKLANDLDWNRINSSDMTRNFSCTASNVAGTAKEIITIEVIRVFPPILANGTKEVVIPQVDDENIILKCQTIQAVPNPTFSWQKHGLNITHEVKNFETESHLILTKITFDDKGEYECSVANIGGVAIKHFNIRVRERQKYWHEIVIAMLCIAVIGHFILVGYFIYINKTHPKISRLHEESPRVFFSSTQETQD